MTLAAQDLGRSTRCYVSGYQRSRVHDSIVIPMETRAFVADFNGALPKGTLITTATWEALNPYSVVMSAAEVIGRETSVLARMQFPSVSMLRCTATLDSGGVYTQIFRVRSRCMPYFYTQPTWEQGPYSITVVPTP